MLYGLEPGSYMTPYRYPHTTKSETLVILRGVALIIEFDSDGAIFDHQLLSAGRGCYGVEVRSELYHTLIALESGTVLFEIEGGKRKHNQKDFAPWAPNGENTEAVSKFQKDLLKQLGFWEKKY
jgi:cupin fold WbuC family metalloprotein